MNGSPATESGPALSRSKGDSVSLTEGRFARLEAIEWWDQALLARSKVLVIGAGALGNEVIKNLALLGIGHVAIADMDRVELSNLSRSILFRESDEGKFKAECAAHAAKQIFPGLNAMALVGNILADLGLGWFRWADFVIGALDNREARVFVNAACARVGRPWIDGGIEVLHGIARGFAPPRTACYECTMSAVDWDLLNKRRSCSLLARRALAQRGTPTTPTTASVIGAIQVQEVVKSLHGRAALIGRGIVFDGMEHSSFTVNYPVNPDCPWHEPVPPVQDLPQANSQTKLRSIWEQAANILGDVDSLDLAREVVEENSNVPPAVPLKKFSNPPKKFARTSCAAVCAAGSPLRSFCIPLPGTVICSKKPPSHSASRHGTSSGRDEAKKRSALSWVEISRSLKIRSLSNHANNMAKEKSSDPKAKQPGAPVNVRSISEEEKPVRRVVPGPRNASSKLRIAVDRAAYAELIAHAKSSLNAEVCGVLAGEVCEDDEGLFVDVQALIRGSAASQSSTHVTFTQDTWNQIHRTLEREYPDLRIVGWYHTHPGFGVEFSEMDLFIQRNFFPGATHLALVTDPLSGDVAASASIPRPASSISNPFWVDGREQKCRIPADKSAKADESSNGAAASISNDRLQALESKVSHLVQALDDMRGFHYRFMLTCGFIFCLALITGVGYSIYRQLRTRYDPPQPLTYAPVPVQIGDKTAFAQEFAVR